MLKIQNIFKTLKKEKYKLFLLSIFITVWLWSWYNPKFPQDWLLENILVFIAFILVVILWKWFKLSNISYTFITIFIILHLIWAHYTYEHVPFWYTLGEWLNSKSFDWEWYRNMYDRLVHFSYWFILYYPFREFFVRVAKAKWFWWYYFPIQSVAAASAIYELMEWWIAVTVAPEAWVAFLWSQGDIWDAQKDMALAILWATISAIIVMVIRGIIDKNFWKELKQSLKINKKPLGEEKIKELLDK